MDWEKFDKYVGIQGILAVVMTIAVLAWNTFDIHTSDEIMGLMGLAWGFYFSKNGSKIISQARARYIEKRIK
jgi:hypothetical protein